MDNNNHISNQDDLWEGILSEKEEVVIFSIKNLSPSEIEYVREHLTKMVTEDGWHPSQQRSAAFALDIISKK
jgi:hypothetical protein